MEEKELLQEVKSIEKRVVDIVINSKETLECVQQAVLDAKRIKKDIDGYFESMQKPAYDAYKAICNRHKEMVGPVDDFIKTKTREASAYLTALERIRIEAQQKLDRERREKEMREREKLETAAAKARDEAEELRKKAEQDEAARKRAEKLEAKAAVLDTKAEDVYVPPAIVESEVEKTTQLFGGSVSKKEDVEVEVTDNLTFAWAVANNKIPATMITVNLAKLKRFIKDNNIESLPGCRIERIIGTSFRGAK